ncbi:unnamed protein product, partial [Ascophyllum nodosum]
MAAKPVATPALAAKRKRECDGYDEGELSRPSKRTLPPSPSVSSDVAVEHVPDSGTRRMR